MYIDLARAPRAMASYPVADLDRAGGIPAAAIDQVGILLLGTVLGWFLIFAVRRYRVQWGAFAAFMSVLFGVGLLTFLFKTDLLAYYGIGMFLGFFVNIALRVVGTAVGGKLGEGLLDVTAFESRKP